MKRESIYKDFKSKIKINSKKLFNELNVYNLNSAYSVINEIINNN